MEYTFDEEMFKKNYKFDYDRGEDALCLQHVPGKRFNLFPFYVNDSKKYYIGNLANIIGEIFRIALQVQIVSFDFQEVINSAFEVLDCEESKKEKFENLVYDLYFESNDRMKTTNLASCLYAETHEEPATAMRMAEYLYSVLMDYNIDIEQLKHKIEEYPYNVLEKLIRMQIKMVPANTSFKPYYSLVRGIVRTVFREDFEFVIENHTENRDSMKNLLDIYYFFYTTQTCLQLERVCDGKRGEIVPLYYALDWEKTSQSRDCFTKGWKSIKNSLGSMLSHANTLEILNQYNGAPLDYIDFEEMAAESKEKDLALSREIDKAVHLYRGAIRDCKEIWSLKKKDSGSETSKSINLLMESVKLQFRKNGSSRFRSSEGFSKKFETFCKKRFLKFRGKLGFILKLTEQDIIFLTRLAIKEKESMRLVEVFKEFNRRGIYFDYTSKKYLLDFYTRLNLIDKKSDSGEAQYVKRIL